MRISIKFKFPAGFTLILLMAFLFLNYFVTAKIDKNNESTIEQELITIRENCNVFIRQVFVINQYNNSNTYYEKAASDIANELSEAIKSEVGVYSLEGRLIYSPDESKFNKAKYSDVQNAQNGKSSYTIKYNGDNTEVYYSYPVIIEGNKVGILRIIKDYSSLYKQGNDVAGFVFRVTVIIFAVVFLFSLLLSRNITLPLTRLARYTNEVAAGNMNVHISNKRGDEIGDLYTNFDLMVRKIDKQLRTISKDRDDLKQLMNHRKYFYDNVTHELKTPLTSILGYAQMIRDNGFSDEEFFDKGTRHIINESKRLQTMVINLLELSRQTSDFEEEFEKVDIGRLLSDTCEVMAFKAGRYGNSFQIKTQDNLFVSGNKNRLKQVFINLIDNAIKYGYPNSEINVDAYLKDAWIYVVIKNKGTGISEKDMERIFIPFYRADKQASREMGSCGLGLSISKAILENHRGEITVRSIENSETTVIVKLPDYNSQMQEKQYEIQ